MLSRREVIFNNTIDLLLSVNWTQKITAKHYDTLSFYSTFIKWGKVVGVLLTSTTVATLFARNTVWAKALAILGTLILTTLEIISNQFNIEKSMAILFNAKEDLWNIKTDITGLAREIKCSSDEDLGNLANKYGVLLSQVKKIQSSIPSAPNRDVNKASKDINDRHDNDLWENRKQLLPPDLLHFKENDNCQ
ncbi:SLATT domain-containing protein [Limosilactobacillus reuteri]|uniref:SLATT domain-containing protein n=1 Tax=Limosilactobacillus reuteri TaxID=1598 RepID=UPI003993B1B2